MSAGGRSRAAALALLAGVVVAAGAALLVPAALYWAKTGDIVETARLKTLRADQRRNATLAVDEKRAEWTAFAQNADAGFVLASSDAVGVDVLKARVTDRFSMLGGSVTAIEAEAGDSPRPGVRAFTLELSGAIPRANLGRLLAALESEPAFLILSRLSAREVSSGRVSISLTARAYRLTGGAS